MNYPSLNFELGETIDMLRDTVRAFAENEIAPRAGEIDHNNEFPNDLWRKLGDLGLLGMTVEEEYGGTDMGYLAHVVAMEEISRASASVRLVLWGAFQPVREPAAQEWQRRAKAPLPAATDQR
jgi:isovaleryl-CoA dehydrogenase